MRPPVRLRPTACGWTTLHVLAELLGDHRATIAQAGPDERSAANIGKQLIHAGLQTRRRGNCTGWMAWFHRAADPRFPFRVKSRSRVA